MTNLPLQPGPVDHKRVDLTEDFDLRYWTAEFACTPAQLIVALESVGVLAVDIGRRFAVQRADALLRSSVPA